MENEKILLLPLIFLMCGCWNYKELNNLAMTTGIAIDKIDNDYHVTLLISNSKNKQMTITNHKLLLLLMKEVVKLCMKLFQMHQIIFLKKFT